MAALLGVGAALAGVLAGCASGPTVPPSSARASASCLIVPGIAAPPAERNEPLTVGLTRPVNPDHAPAPTNPDEAFLFGLLYESLVGIDCTGRLLSGLASAWESDDGGRRWTFTLRTDARFWDGDPVTARHVADGWRRLEESGRSPWVGARPASVEVLDPRRLQVTVAEALGQPPAVLASQALAVAGPATGGAWPSPGTGPYRVDLGAVGDSTGPSGSSSDALSSALSAVPSGGTGGEILLRPTLTADESRLPTLRILVDPAADPRDLLGAGADLIITADPDTRAYAALRSDLVSRPLPWSRRYVVAVRRPGVEAPASLLEELARDVVREEARPAPAVAGDPCTRTDPRDRGTQSPPGVRSSSRGRPAPATPRPSPTRDDPRPRIGFSADDPTARALAERLVALTAAAAGGNEVGRSVLLMLGLDEAPAGLVAAPVEPVPAELAPSEIGRVTALPLRADGTCATLETFRRSGDFHRLIPLVDTRVRVFARTEVFRRIGLATDGFGTPFLVGGSR